MLGDVTLVKSSCRSFVNDFAVFLQLILHPYSTQEIYRVFLMNLRPLTLAQRLVRDWSGQTLQHPRCAQLLSSTSYRFDRPRARLDIPPPFPVIKSCPDPTCGCPLTPSMPEGLPIDHDQALNGTMVSYAQQLLVCTGQRDWASRIEDDGEGKAWGKLVRGLKRLMGRGGPYLDVGSILAVYNSQRIITDPI